MSQWLDFLNLLLSFGPKLDEIMEIVQHIVEDFQKLVSLVAGRTAESGPPDVITMAEVKIDGNFVSAEVLAKEEELVQRIGRSGPFQNILAFIKSHPELIAILLKLLSG